MEITFKIAKDEDEKYILHANKEIDIVSDISSSKLSKNLVEDVLHNQKAICLISKVGDENAGMIMFSKVYWADRGEGIYISQVFVEEKFRKQGIMKMMFKQAFDYFDDTKFVTCLVGANNKIMQDCVRKLNFEFEDMRSYVIDKENF